MLCRLCGIDGVFNVLELPAAVQGVDKIACVQDLPMLKGVGLFALGLPLFEVSSKLVCQRIGPEVGVQCVSLGFLDQCLRDLIRGRGAWGPRPLWTAEAARVLAWLGRQASLPWNGQRQLRTRAGRRAWDESQIQTLNRKKTLHKNFERHTAGGLGAE